MLLLLLLLFNQKEAIILPLEFSSDCAIGEYVFCFMLNEHCGIVKLLFFSGESNRIMVPIVVDLFFAML